MAGQQQPYQNFIPPNTAVGGQQQVDWNQYYNTQQVAWDPATQALYAAQQQQYYQAYQQYYSTQPPAPIDNSTYQQQTFQSHQQGVNQNPHQSYQNNTQDYRNSNQGQQGQQGYQQIKQEQSANLGGNRQYQERGNQGVNQNKTQDRKNFNSGQQCAAGSSKQGHNNNQSGNRQNQQRDNEQASTSNQSSFKKVQSPLNDFGDMGAAVRNYAVNDADSKNNRFESDGIKREDNHPYRKQHGLTAWDDFSDTGIPEPFKRFDDFPDISKEQLDAFYRAGFQDPTPIQAQTWPVALQERDVVSIAKTGSGKTLAFLMPAYKKISNFSRGRNHNVIHALVLAPTRELATQIQEESEKFGRVAGYNSACAYGGAPKRDQLRTINAGVSVLVATPGRLNDFIESQQVDLSGVFYLVLDEADRMLDLGFEPQIRSIIKRLPRKRQTLMFSATWPEEVRRLANDFLYQPIHIRVGSSDGGLQANESIQQQLILLRSGEEKDGELVKLIQSRFQRNRELVLIFVARKNTCDFVANMLSRFGVPAAAMHGDRDQEYRERTLAAFRNGSKPILVATDVASRGIDVKGISAVVNYDLANSTEDYVHRIGRTGRAGMTGESFTFITHSNDDVWKVMGIVEIMEKNGQRPPPQIQEMIDRLKYRQEQNKQRRDAENEQFQKVLLVAEKPSVAKAIAEHLSGGRFRTRRGQSRANQIFEFIKWFGPAQQKCKLMVTSVVGHIFGLNFEEGPVRDVSKLFTAKTKKVVENTTKKLRIVEHLQELGQESDYLYLWLDCDREGENIGFEVISLTQDFVHYDNVYRARFSALTRTELVNAYENPVRPDKYAAMSVDARQELDLKIGVAFSRLMTRGFLNMAKEKFRLKDQRVISYGPCQTPTLWFCVQRHKEIKSFRPDKFYVVSVTVNLHGQQLRLKWINDKVTDQGEVNQMETAVRSAQNARVLSVTEEKKIVRKPLGLNTVTLLKACSKGLGLSPTNAMHVAEHLYTSGYISYPRTETSSYPPTFDLAAALEEQANHPNWGKVVSYLLRSGRINRPESGFDVGDHPPITPLRAAHREEFSKGSEWRIYDYVTRHFIASLHDDMEYMEKTLLVDINGFQFQYAWHEVLEKGFTFAMPWKMKSLQLNEVRMPGHIQEGQPMHIVNFSKVEEFTKHPDYLQESELITLMDKHGIGTDASIPQHIKNIQERNYADVCGPGENGERGLVIKPPKFFGKGKKPNGPPPERPTSRHMVPRGFGLAFLACFEDLDMELCEPSIRSYMEQQVKKIATGETEKNEVVESNLKLFLEKFIYFRDNLERVNRFFAPKGQGGFNQNNQGGFQRGNDFGGGHRGGMNDRGGRGGRGARGGRGGTRGGFKGNQQQDNYPRDHANSFDRPPSQQQQRGGRGGRGARGGGGSTRGGFNDQQQDNFSRDRSDNFDRPPHQQQRSGRGGRGARGGGGSTRGGFNDQQQDNFPRDRSDNFDRPPPQQQRGGRGGRGARGGGGNTRGGFNSQQQDRSDNFDRPSSQQQRGGGGSGRGRGDRGGSYQNNGRGSAGGNQNFGRGQNHSNQQQQYQSNRGGRGSGGGYRGGSESGRGRGSNGQVGQKRGGVSPVPPSGVDSKRVHHSY